MHYSLYLILGCTVFLLILIAIYFSKKNYDYLKNKIYRILLFGAILVISTEIVEIQLYASLNHYMLANIFLHIHWTLGMLWTILLIFYFLCYLFYDKNVKIQDIFKNKYNIILFIVLILLVIVSLFLPVNEIDENNIKYISGLYLIYCMCFIGLCVLIFLILLIKKKNRTRDNILAVVMISLIGSIIMVFQLIYTSYSVIALSLIVILYILYIISENPALDIADELSQVKNEIDKSSKVKTDVILSMSHDIRSPMNAIVNYSSNISELTELNKDEIKSDINNILVSGKNLLNIIGDVLDLSSSNKDNDADSHIYKLRTILDDLINITSSRIGTKQIKLMLNITDNVPKTLKGNSIKLYRIIMNILSNSAKYTDVGKITISVDATTIDNNGKVMLHFRISDTGFGIKDEDKAKVFSEFGRLNDATHSNIEGTGLGLINTKKNVENMGGKMWFDSIYGAGTTFYVDIPQLVANDNNLDKDANDVFSNSNLLSCKDKKVLIVDDNKLNIKVVTKLLERYQFTVDNASSGEECINKIKLENKYDLIFMDVLLKGMDGIELMKTVKQLNKLYDIPPVVALTANAVSGARKKYMTEGFDEYISKPIDINELDRVINLFLKSNNISL